MAPTGNNWTVPTAGPIGDEVNDIAVDPGRECLVCHWQRFCLNAAFPVNGPIIPLPTAVWSITGSMPLLCDNVGRIWLGTYAGLMSFLRPGLAPYPNFNAQLQTPNMKRLVIDRVNKLWVLYESAARFSNTCFQYGPSSGRLPWPGYGFRFQPGVMPFFFLER